VLRIPNIHFRIGARDSKIPTMSVLYTVHSAPLQIPNWNLVTNIMLEISMVHGQTLDRQTLDRQTLDRQTLDTTNHGHDNPGHDKPRTRQTLDTIEVRL
jgi:hypothetical protein